MTDPAAATTLLIYRRPIDTPYELHPGNLLVLDVDLTRAQQIQAIRAALDMIGFVAATTPVRRPVGAGA